jgi:predicted TIM-barrel fold metal-dependent hydrolase
VIIDCHTHIFPDEIRNNRGAFCRRDKGFSSIYRNAKARMAGVEDLIASMDASGVERSVICGFPWNHPDLCSFHNDYLKECGSRFPSRLIVFVSLPFSDPDRSEEELDRGIEGGAKGVGEAAFYHRQMTWREIEAMKPILTRMENLRMVLLLHANERIGHSYPGKGMTPLERFYDLILSYPHLPIVLAHWGGGLPFYELMPEVKKGMTHVYYDTAASPFVYSKEIYAVVNRIVGAAKILFGSDFPLISPQRYFRDLEESGLPEEDQKKILGLNFSKLISREEKGGE